MHTFMWACCIGIGILIHLICKIVCVCVCARVCHLRDHLISWIKATLIFYTHINIIPMIGWEDASCVKTLEEEEDERNEYSNSVSRSEGVAQNTQNKCCIVFVIFNHTFTPPSPCHSVDTFRISRLTICWFMKASSVHTMRERHQPYQIDRTTLLFYVRIKPIIKYSYFVLFRFLHI